MRLIDADALSKAMYDEAFENDESYNETNPMARWDSGLWIRYKMFENILKNAPTIEPCEDAVRVYEYLKEELGSEIVSDQKEFEAWFDRMIWHVNMIWHVKRCDELGRMVCEDAISRAWVKENMLKYGFSALDMTVTEFVEDAPSVAPSRPSGMDELVEGFAKALTYEDVITAEAEAKGYAQGFKDGMESRPSGEWIPCNERMPSDGIIVLVTVLFDDYGDVTLAFGSQYKEKWNLRTANDERINYGYTVLAWMPLPEPYKESE